VSTYPRWRSDHFGRLGFDPQVACEREVAEGGDREAARDLEEHGGEGHRVGQAAVVLAVAGDEEFRAVRATGPTVAEADTVDAGDGVGRAGRLDGFAVVVQAERRSDPTGLRAD